MKRDIQDYKRLLWFVKPHIWVLIRASVCMLMFSVLNGISITVVIPLFDNIISGKGITIPPHVTPPLFITNLVEKINSIPVMHLITMLLVGMIIYFFLRKKDYL